MPLFKKRSSQKDKNDKTSSAKKEVPPFSETDTKATNTNVLPDISEVLEELVSNVSTNVANEKVLKDNLATSIVANSGKSLEKDSTILTSKSEPGIVNDLNGMISAECSISKYEESTINISSEQSDSLISNRETNSVSSDTKSGEESVKNGSSNLETETLSKKSKYLWKTSSASSNVMSRIEANKYYSTVHSSDSAEDDGTSSNSKQKLCSKASKQKKRSSSITHSEINFETRQKGRRRFGSEGEVLPISDKIFPVKQKKELDEVIGKYVDKLIRDSIVKAVRNVNVDTLYEEIVKDFSNRRSSESAESIEEYTVQQRLSSHSISELVELESEGNEENNTNYINSVTKNFTQRLDGKDTSKLEFDNVDHASLVGYLADYEDTTSIDDVKSIEENSSICMPSNDFEGQGILGGNVKGNCEHILKTSETTFVKEEAIRIIDSSKPEKENIVFPAEGDPKQNQSVVSATEGEKKLPFVNKTCNKGQSISEPQTSSTDEQAISLSKNINKPVEKSLSSEMKYKEEQKTASSENTAELMQNTPSSDSNCKEKQNPSPEKENKEQKEALPVNKVEEQDLMQEKVDEKEQFPEKCTSEQIVQNYPPAGSTREEQQELPPKSNSEEAQKSSESKSSNEEKDLIVMSVEDDILPPVKELKSEENSTLPPDIDENLPQLKSNAEEEKKVNWKCGHLHVKLPHKSRGKTHLKAWKKRCVAIQPDEFVNDPKNPSLVISVYGAEPKKHGASFWQTVSSQKAVVYRSSSRSHRYAFTIAEDGHPIIHLSADSETATQEWMAAIRAVLWPPSPFMELEKMLNGREFEISLIDNDFSYHAGLLGMYGYLTITPKKLILLHPQQGFVIQEWYLNTVDKFQFVPQPKPEDNHKVLAMVTCSDSSTGCGEILLFCNEAVTLLQSLASTIHQVLTYHSKQEGGRYKKEMEEMAEWMIAPPQDTLEEKGKAEDHYKVPTRQVKSLLDIPNFIFDKSLSPVASAIYPAPSSVNITEPLADTKANPATASHDSGISTCTSSDDFLNCSLTSFVLGGGPLTGKSSDSELSDAYTPPISPVTTKKIHKGQLKEESSQAEVSA